MILRGGEEADIHLSRIYLRWGGGGEVEPTFGQIFFATPENFTIKLRKQGTHLSGHLLKINRFFYDNIINDVSMTGSSGQYTIFRSQRLQAVWSWKFHKISQPILYTPVCKLPHITKSQDIQLLETSNFHQ